MDSTGLVTMKLWVVEAYLDDIDRNLGMVCRISSENMRLLSLKENDIVQIKGQGIERSWPGRAVVRCLPLLNLDGGAHAIIRIDGVVRHNAHVSVMTDMVEVGKLENIPPATHAILAEYSKYPKPSQLPTQMILEKYFCDKLADAPLTIDNVVLLPYNKVGFAFKVVELYPADIAVVTKDTEFKILTAES